MKKLILFSALALMATACSNSPKEDAVEQQQRDSAITEQKSEDEQLVAEIMRQDSIREAQEKLQKDSSMK
ncbi:MAG: hypothetical protein IT245_00435 [Bacteroidia bacterium]|nr:hypothetical protein [Bacteroidia bacterium]